MNLIELLGATTRENDLDSEDNTASGVLDSALRQFELFGLRRSTMEGVARRAKLTRVTIYRHFPGKERLVEAVILRELNRFLSDLDCVVDPLEDSEDKIVEGFVYTVQAARSHALLQRLLEAEPETLLPYLTTEGAPFIAAASEFLAERIRDERPVDRGRHELQTTAELVVRLILSFLLTPQFAIDLDDPDKARAFASRYLGPILNGDREGTG